jgi:hypothetical protein
MHMYGIHGALALSPPTRPAASCAKDQRQRANGGYSERNSPCRRAPTT